jgi:hypothetical protein
LSCGVGAGVGAGTGLGVRVGRVGEGVFVLTGVEVRTGCSVATGGTKPLVGDGRARSDVGAGVLGAGVLGAGVLGAGVLGAWVFGAGVLGADAINTGVFGRGVAPGALTDVDDPAGTDTATPPALVSTVPEIVTIVVSPLGDTVTNESDPARITDAMPALRTS